MTRTVRHQSEPNMDGLTTSDRMKYLRAIDRLRELGISDNLVVVGDQSSGKSSLLEGLTGFGFPVASDLCTRFATQIILKRSAHKNVSISIITSLSSREDESLVKKYSEFEHTIEEGKLDSNEVAEIIAKASKLMGLPATLEESTDPSVKRFSRDLLRIEISGPDHENLSVVDVPGLFHNPTKYQTDEDKTIIREMIKEYIEDERTIILAVLDARNNLANQEVFDLAREADKEGIRTVGIITKCDALQDGDEDGVLRIARNEVERLRYGWFVVRNRSTKEIQDGVTMLQRHEKERTFFAQKPWSSLDEDHRGVPALKSFLGDLLYDHIRREFPNVAAEVERLCAETQLELDNMGAPRQTVVEQRQYMSRVVTAYQTLVNDSKRGNYDPDLEPKHPLKLRMHLRMNNDEFEKKLMRNGHKYAFCTVEDKIDENFARDGMENNIGTWIRTQYRDSRGAELPGTVNPLLVENLFRQQSKPWEQISLQYIEAAEQMIKDFNEAALSLLVPEPRLKNKMLAQLQAIAVEVAEATRTELSKLLTDERSGILQTINHYFADTLNAIREERVLKRLEKLCLRDQWSQTVNIKDILRAAHLSNEDQAVNDVHDILKAYYKVAVKRFGDAVLKNVTERHLEGSHGALSLFTPDFVLNLEEDKLTAIAEESMATSRQRDDIRRRLELFIEARKVVRSLQDA